jgi:hypothetical protein
MMAATIVFRFASSLLSRGRLVVVPLSIAMVLRIARILMAIAFYFDSIMADHESS